MIIIQQNTIRHIRILIFLVIFTEFLSGCRVSPYEETVEIPIEYDTTDHKPVLLSYGVPVDSFLISSGHIRRNQFLVDILKKYRVPYETVNALISNNHTNFDFRKVKTGKEYKIFSPKNSPEQVRYFIYIEDPINYYVFDLSKSPSIRHVQKPVRSELKLTSGTIQTSLWQTMKDQELPVELALKLSEIYAWTIDFFGLEKGDHFKVFYEEQYVDSTSFGVNRILAAGFQHAGKIFYAVPFEQDGKEDYFDEEGNSLRKAFLKAPLRFSHISSRFSNSRLHPILKIRRPHHGVDYAAPSGTPVHAIGDGKVIAAGYKGQGGNRVTIRHNSIYTTSYMHLSRYGKGIHQGVYVTQGQVIGYVGKTGLATGPHLDFRFYKNGKAIDPLKVKAPSVAPVKEENREAYGKVSRVMIELLQTIQ